MASTFRDHFSSSSSDYARFRPRYPRALFAWVASESPARARVWDAATGSGQAALGLADDFALVVATDASRAQLASAAPHARVRYVRSTAEASGLADRSMDAITVAQAVHWFDRRAFFDEARRVARPGALVAVWTYGNPSVSPEVDALLMPFYRDVVGPYWPPERRLIENLYRDVEVPFAPVAAPELWLETPMTLDALAGYIGTWSAVQRYREVVKRDPLPDFIASVASIWGEPASVKPTRWPMAIRAGRVS
ncbi:MAG: class I SAM-dependent methyltransferase [Acidobacteria bacterium]|nr:class I SAM-dependent methyltransferase [Acidobacteriota bacterium]